MPMVQIMLLCSVGLLACVGSSKLLYKLGIPTLILFIGLGMLTGSDGLGGFYFDNYELAQQICSVGLVFIMFYGGFGTNVKIAKPVLPQSILMSTLGVIITALLTGLFCHFFLGMSLMEGLLVGSVVGSTDAASVFAILRSRNLNLKGGLASLLEIESGSNDPIAYMLTITILSFLSPQDQTPIIKVVFLQIVFGILIGVVVGKLAALVLRKINFEITGLYYILVIAIAMLGYSLSETLGGNGYLSVYLVGIILGNSRIMHKRSLVHFFDGLSWIMQILLFFTIGLLSFPSQIPAIIWIGVAVWFFMTFFARPIATFGILSFFKVPIKQQLLVSWVGLRGAASVVFAIYAMTMEINMESDLFHIVFFVAMLSVLVQGTLIPPIAKKLDLVDEETTVFKTFTDYQEELGTRLVEFSVPEDHRFVGKSIMNANIPEDILVVMIKRKGDVLVPKGSTVIQAGDILVFSGNRFEDMPELIG